MSHQQWVWAGLAALVVLVCDPPGGVRAQQLDHDTGLPIEITADSLEVVQADRIATFEGNVDAVQGQLTLSADRLRVHYRGSGQDEEANAGPSGSGGTIRRIEAFGNVVLTSPDETARGEVGVYDVATRQVTLDRQVVLTRQQNVIRGEHLVLDLDTGVSRVVARSTASEGAPPEERVRAIFTPQEGGGGQDEENPDRPAGGTPTGLPAPKPAGQ